MIPLEKDAVKLTRQIAATMAMENMALSESEYDVLLRCAAGEQSITLTIQEMIARYTEH